MAFIWKGSDSKGNIISYSDIKEVTDHVDFADDNLGYIDSTTSCLSHNITYDSGNFNTEYDTHRIGNDLSQRTSNLASPYYLGNDTAHRIGHRSGHNSVVRSVHYVSAHCATYYNHRDTTPHNSSNRSAPHYLSVRSPHNSSVQTTHNSHDK